MEADRPVLPPRADDAQAPQTAAPLQSRQYKLIIGRFLTFAVPTILSLVMVIFLAMPAGILQQHRLDVDSSLPSLNISISLRKLTVEYTYMRLLLSSDGQLTLSLSRPSLVSNSSQAPGYGTSLQAKAQTTLSIVTGLGIKDLEVTIDVAAKAKRNLQLGPWWAVMLNLDVSCTAQSNSEDGSNQMIMEGTLTLDIVPEL